MQKKLYPQPGNPLPAIPVRGYPRQANLVTKVALTIGSHSRFSHHLNWQELLRRCPIGLPERQG